MLSKIGNFYRISKLAKFTPAFTQFYKPQFNFTSVLNSPQNLHYSDVLKVHEDERGYFLNLPGRTISLEAETTLHQFKALASAQYNDIRNIKVLDEKLVEFSDTAPTVLLLRENFLLKINEEWYSVITETEDPLFNVKTDHNLRDKTVFALCENAGFSIRQTATLGKFISSLTNDLYDHAHSQVDSHIVKTIVEKNLYGRSIEAKSTIEQIEMKLEFLQKKLESFEAIKTAADEKLMAKANKRLKRFCAFIFAQLLAIQYGTYVAFSWDVMEPITCLLGIIDVIIAYSFWLVTNKSFSYRNIGMNYIESRRQKAYRKLDFDIDEYEETKKLIKLLETQKLLLSPKIEDLLKAIQLFEDGASGKKDEEEDDD